MNISEIYKQPKRYLPLLLASSVLVACAQPQTEAEPSTKQTSSEEKLSQPSPSAPATETSVTGISFSYYPTSQSSGQFEIWANSNRIDREATINLRCEDSVPCVQLETFKDGSTNKTTEEYGFPDMWPKPCVGNVVQDRVSQHPALYGSWILAGIQANEGLSNLK